MKSPYFKAAVAFFLLPALAALTLAGGILYWHLRIRSALRDLEQTTRSERRSNEEEGRRQRSVDTLMAAGCRTLPYLVDALDETRGDEFMTSATFLIVWESVLPGGPAGQVEDSTLARRFENWMITAKDSPEGRRTKCERIREWWKENGPEHHQIWRFWTAHCRPYAPSVEDP
jgi:hypothetical protein